MLRWTELQSRQSRTAYGTLDHVGFLAPQSKHVLFLWLHLWSVSRVRCHWCWQAYRILVKKDCASDLPAVFADMAVDG